MYHAPMITATFYCSCGGGRLNNDAVNYGCVGIKTSAHSLIFSNSDIFIPVARVVNQYEYMY